MNRSERVPEGFRKGSHKPKSRVRKPLICEKAHTCTCTYTCNSTISTPVPVTGTTTSRRAAPCTHPNVDRSTRVTAMRLRRGNRPSEKIRTAERKPEPPREPRDPAEVINAHLEETA